MTELHGPAPEDMKIGETYEVVEDKEHGGIRLEKIEGNTLSITIPEGLLKILKVEAILADMTLEECIVDDLRDLIDSRLDADPYYHEWVEQAYKSRQPVEKELPAK